MKNFTTFKTLQDIVKENEVAAASPEVAVSSPDISSDVDTIINSLETLANELTEELDSMPLDENGATDFIAAWITSMRAASAQKKVNKIKMNSADLEFASNNAKGDKEKVLSDKSDAIKAQADELQKLVDDRFSGKGAIVDRKLARTKIEGQLALIKRTSGMEDDPDRKSDLKTKMKELADRYKEENDAIAKLEDDNAEAIEAEKERLRKEKESKKTEPKTEPAKDPETEPAKDPETEPTKDPETEPKETEPKETEPKETEPKETEPKIKAAQDEISKLEQDLADSEQSPDKNKQGIEVLKSAIAGKKKALQSLKDKLNPKESLVNRAKSAGLNELAIEIESKLEWQLHEGSMLFAKYNEIIKKTESLLILNENRYNDLSIKDRFSRLL